MQDAQSVIIQAAKDAGVTADIKITSVAGDLSPRRYFRVERHDGQILELGEEKSFIAMVFDSTEPPEAETSEKVYSDDAYILLTHFFEKYGVPVPSIYLERKDLGVLFIEDLGARPLIEVALSDDDKLINSSYSSALDIIETIQSIPIDNSFFAFNRSLDAVVFKKESLQFINFVIPSLDESVKNEVMFCIEYLIKEIESMPQVLVHRDFHSWNLMLDSKGSVRLIDFQDALLGPKCYDLVALLHERDIDYVLDSALIDSLEERFFKDMEALREYEYPRVQLQRDLKVSGLFKRVLVERGLATYSKWIPGTLSRMQKTIDILCSQDTSYQPLKKAIAQAMQEV